MSNVSDRRNILLAIGVYDPQEGGASEWVRNYTAWLFARGYQVTILCGRSQHTPPKGCSLLTLPVSEYSRNSWKRAVSLQKIVDKIDIDIVHDTGCLLRSDVFHPLMGSLSHNWFHQLWAYPLKERLRRFWHISMWRDVRLQLYQCKHSKLVIAASQRVAADLRQFNCKNPFVIHNGIHPLQTKSSSLESIQKLRQALGTQDRILILVTATNFYLKGVMTVLRALEMMDAKLRRSFLVVIAGHNQDMRFAKYIDDHHLRDSCVLTGWIDNIEDYYQAADIFLHPTYHDAGSLSTLKGLAAGCAVVSSKFDGSADYIQSGLNGIVIERPDDAKEIASILEQLLDPELRTQLGRRAQQLIPSISQERQFEQINALYSQYLYVQTDQS